MKKMRIFNHALFGEIRTLVNEQGETFFVGKDVAEALGYSKPQTTRTKALPRFRALPMKPVPWSSTRVASTR